MKTIDSSALEVMVDQSNIPVILNALESICRKRAKQCGKDQSDQRETWLGYAMLIYYIVHKDIKGAQ